MERNKLIEILENGSEAELTLIQNYLLDQILKKMPTEAEAIKRCVETSEKIKELEEEITNLKLQIRSLEAGLHIDDTPETWSVNTTDWLDGTATIPASYGSTGYYKPSSTTGNNTITYTSITTI